MYLVERSSSVCALANCMHIFMMQNLEGLLGDSVNERPRNEAMERV